jgi:lysophospholipase L1-like esterase
MLPRMQMSSGARRLGMWVIVLLFPVVVLALTEVFLRLAGFGHGLEPLFLESPVQKRYLQANPRVVTRFFADPSQAPNVSIETAYFRSSKPPGTFRVFVQGESSAAGFPYGLGASLAGVLDQRLERAFPTREIEVVSTAMAAVTTYALVDFVDEIIAQQPDAVVVYVGHNEFLGILGVGSTMRMSSRPWLTRAFLRVRELRLFQLLSHFHAGLATQAPLDRTGSADSLMAAVAGERSIALRSTTYQAGLEQFESNVDTLLRKYQEARIPVFIGTLVSNERDQVPLAVLAGIEAEAARSAKTAYEAAQDAETARHLDGARDGYAWARDLDPLRFRAPTQFNDVLRRVATRRGARLVDVHRAFVSASPNGLVGSHLMLEHVHPNLDGYFLLADAFFDAMTQAGLPGSPEVVVAEGQARREIPVSDVDRLLGEYKIRRVRRAWPFVTQAALLELPPPTSAGEQIAQELYRQRIAWTEAHEQLRRHHLASGNTEEYARTTLILADAFPFTGPYQFDAAAALIALDRPAESLRYSRRAVELEPRNVNHLLVQAHGLLLTGRTDEGRAALVKVVELEPGNPTARQVLDQIAGK